MIPRNSPRLALLRTRAAGGLWILGAVWTLLLAWQALVGWPLAQSVVITCKPSEPAAGIYEGRIPSRIPALDWNAPWVRTFVDGVEYLQLKDPDQLSRVNYPASRVKGDRVRLRAPGQPILTKATLRVPWLPARVVMAWTLATFFALSLLLFWGRHPLFPALGRHLCRLPLLPSMAALIFAAALFLRMRGFAFPTWEHDSDDYFRPVFQWLSGLPLTPTDRPLGYPLFIALALKLFADFRVLLYLQMAASLLAGAGVAIIFFRAARALFVPSLLRSGVQAAGLAAAALFLFSERVLQREWHLLPEALAALWLALQLCLAWRLMSQPLGRGRLLVEFGLFCALGWLVFFTKSNWGFALALLPVLLVGAVLLRSTNWRELVRGTTQGLAVLIVVTGGAWFVQHLTPLNTQASVEIRSRVFVCWHIDLIKLEIQERLTSSPSPKAAGLLHELDGLIDEEMALTRARGAGVYQKLGFDGDRIYYVGFRKAARYRALPSSARIAFCQDLFFSAVRHHPWLYLRKVVRQMSRYFGDPYDSVMISPGRALASLEQSEQLLANPPAYLPADIQAHYRPVVDRARASLTEPWPQPARHALSLRMEGAYEWLNLAFAPVLGLSLAVLLAAALWPRWRAAVPWRPLTPVLGLLLWATGSAIACALTSSMLQALEIQRYIDLFLPLTLLSELLWPCLAVALLRSWFRKARPSTTLPEKKTLSAP